MADDLRNARDLDAYWMPFTANRAFKQKPRIVARAETHHYITDDGRRILDAHSGLWTTGVGHCRPEIVEAVRDQLSTLDYAPAFQVGHPSVFQLAEELSALAPNGLNRVFFTNSGSEAVESALKIALAYQAARGKPRKTRLIGRERGYHGVNIGGMSVGGIPPNRTQFSPLVLGNVSHLPVTHDLARNAFSVGQPKHGADFAEPLAFQIRLHGAEQIAAVIVEPVAGSTGVLPPPVGYLERLRALCDEHDILLIFDEVITAFGRIGAPFAAQRFGVTPDIITTAKGLTNGVIPMGAVLVRQEIHDAFMQGPPHAIELFHGYTYSGHPAAVAAGLASLKIYRDESSFEQSRTLEGAFGARIHKLKGAKNVIDVRNFGLMGAAELAPRAGAPGARGLEAHVKCFEQGVVIRAGGDSLQFAPFLNGTEAEIEETFAIVERVLNELD